MGTDSAVYVKGEELFQVFQSIEWEDLYTRLEAYIIYTLKYKYGVEKRTEQLESMAHEIISEVMDLIFVSGTRNWCKASCPSFNSFIFGVVKSHINNMFSTTSKKYSVIAIEDVQYDTEMKHFVEPENLDRHKFRNVVFDELKKMEADDDELMVFECMADGIVKPEKIRQELGISPSHLNNIIRRLNRKTLKLRNNNFDI
jgi:hypothetical protein